MNDDSPRALLEVKDLSVTFPSHQGPVHALRGVSFSLGNEKLGIVGETGSGKSTIGRAILRILPSTAQIGGRIFFRGEDLYNHSERQMQSLRGAGISMILQDPHYSLNPVMTVGSQVAETLRVHTQMSRAKAKSEALRMLAAVKIRKPERVFRLYPHEISGGMGQRIMIAMMLVANPQLVVADEPTSALDVTVRMEVLAILDGLVDSSNLGLLLISHDLDLVSTFCDRIIIMYAGRIVETCASSEIEQVEHPYARGLLQARPRIDQPQARLPELDRSSRWLDDGEVS